MCLTIPKKVISIGKDKLTVEDFKGNRQEVKTIIKLETGDYCLTQQGVAIQKIDPEYADEINKILNNK